MLPFIGAEHTNNQVVQLFSDALLHQTASTDNFRHYLFTRPIHEITRETKAAIRKNQIEVIDVIKNPLNHSAHTIGHTAIILGPLTE